MPVGPGQELPEHNAFDDTFFAVDDGIGMLGWTYDDSTVRVRDGVDSS